MRCEHCHGRGYSYPPRPGKPDDVRFPCPDCGGSGWAHCCEGERPMEHIASPECWCGPVQDTEEPNVWVHKI
jgi:hypothetical protein